MTASHNHETSIVGTVLVEVNKTLKASEAGSLRVLILMSPSLVGRCIFSVRPLNIDDVKGDDEVVGAIDSANERGRLGFK